MKNSSLRINHRLLGTFLVLLTMPGLSMTDELVICRDHAHFQGFGIDLDGDGRRYAPDRHVDILHLRIDVVPDFQARTVSGTTRLEFRPIARPCSLLTLDAVDLSVSDVRSDFGVKDFVNTGKQLLIYFDQPIPIDEDAFVEIDHSAQPTRGLYFRTPEMGYPATDTQIWTQGESHEARFWFPCFDYPNERSSTEVICHVPQDMIVLSNGRQISDSIDDRGLRRVHWLQEKPHVNYLLCLVAGKFVEFHKRHRDVPLRFFSQPSLAEHAENAFADTDQIMAFFESEIGMPFPWEKYDQVTILDFIAGGMENTTLTTLTERTVYSKATENVRSSHPLDAHEMAHQWFGDLVTCKDWGHLWLNEGFATYYTHLYEGHKNGSDAMLYGLYRDAENRILPQSRDQRGIVYRDYKNPAEQFDYRSYPKGSWVLHMLRSQLGSDLYRMAIRDYLQRYQLRSVVSDDLRKVVEEFSGRPFDRFFDQWVYHGGCPELTVKSSWDGSTGLAKVTVQQTHDVNDRIMLFHFPTKLRFVVDDQVVDHDVVISEEEHEFYVPTEIQPTIVRFDPEYTVLAKITFNKSEDMLVAQLARQDDVIGRLKAAKSLESRKTIKSVTALKQALNEDPFYGVRIAASEALRTIGTDEAFRAIADSQQQTDARVRRQVTADLGEFYRSEAQDELLRVLEREQNPEIQSVAIQGLAKYQDDRTRDVLTKYLNRRSFRNALTEAAVRAIGQQKSPELSGPLRDVIESRSDEFSTRGLASALTTLGQINQSVQSSEKESVRQLLNGFLEDPRSTVRQGAIRGLGQLRDGASAPVLESLVRTERDDRVATAAKSALEQLQASAVSPPREVVELRQQLTELRKTTDELKKELKSLQARVDGREAEAASETPTDEVVSEPDSPNEPTAAKIAE